MGPFGDSPALPIVQTPGVGTNTTPFLEVHDLGGDFIVGSSFFPPVGATSPFSGAAPVSIGGKNYAVGYINGQRIALVQGSTALNNAYTLNATTYLYADDLGNLYYEATQSGPAGSVYLGSVKVGATAVTSVSIAIARGIVVGVLNQTPQLEGNQTPFLVVGDICGPFTVAGSFLPVSGVGGALTTTLKSPVNDYAGNTWALGYIGSNNKQIQRVAIPAGDSRLAVTYAASTTTYDWIDTAGNIYHTLTNVAPASSYQVIQLQAVTTNANSITAITQNLYSGVNFNSGMSCNAFDFYGGGNVYSAVFHKPFTNASVGITNLSGALAAGTAFTYTNNLNYTIDIAVAVSFGAGGSLTTSLNGTNWPVPDSEPATSIAGVTRVIMRRIPNGGVFVATPDAGSTIKSVDYNYA